MTVVWVLVSLVFLAVILLGLFNVVVSEPGLETVHVTRDVVQVGLALTALVLYVLITGERLNLNWTMITAVVGLLTGYVVTRLGGQDVRSGIALVPTSKVYPLVSLVSAAAALIGALGAGVQVLAIGLLGYYFSAAMGVGRFASRFAAARRAALAFSADVWQALDRGCVYCTATLQAADRFCRDCGNEQPHICGSCGVSTAAGAAACGSCGAPIAPPETAPHDAVWQRTCLVCATPVGIDDDFCSTCGVEAVPACPHCGGPALPGEIDCPVCGIDLEVARVAMADDAAARATGPSACAECGTTNRAGNRFCAECGEEL